ncbi:GNAT family N-acetyltransferase [Spirochaeta cellobiosiphila]|uniref:GNAT family N-acetyltransferase n=1 Tax=Spirochaeta cellobiosiphila TaxID=504483 RepID=UPI00041A2A7C|nr:GNAT family N-acetyltransferase [Spirochaeta cellobiosiphila]
MSLLLQADPNEDLVCRYLKTGSCYVTEIENEIVAVILIMTTKKGTMEIMNLSVREDWQNKGIGKQLILHVIDDIKKLKDIRTIEIGTGNPGAIQMLLYQKCGFRIVGIDFDFFRRNYPEPIYENGIECRDMIRLRMDIR